MKRFILSTVAALIVGAGSALAHHSWAGFEATPVTFEGRVEALRIENPHTLIEIRGTDNERYVVVWRAPTALMRIGYALDGPRSLKELIKVGDSLVVTGRVKREETAIEVLPLQIDHKAHGALIPAPSR